jgi:hypothetical protein
MSAPLLRPAFGMRYVGTVKETFVRAVVIEARFLVRGGYRPAVGEEVEMPLSDARDRAHLGHVRILPETERVVDTGVRIEDPPGRGRNWMTEW